MNIMVLKKFDGLALFSPDCSVDQGGVLLKEMDH